MVQNAVVVFENTPPSPQFNPMIRIYRYSMARGNWVTVQVAFNVAMNQGDGDLRRMGGGPLDAFGGENSVK